MKPAIHLIACVAVLALAACGSKETLRFESGPITLSAEGPLFEGANTAQGNWETGLAEFLKENGATLDQLKHARVVEATLAADSANGLNGIRSVSVMMATDAADMVQVAVLNPLPADAQTVTLSTAAEQKGLADHLRQNTITVVADLDLTADSDDDRHVTGSFTIELQLKR